VQPQEWRQQNIDAVAETNQVVRNEKSDPTKGDGGEQLEAAPEQAGSKRQRHAAN
jgi:hypothetical protein